MNINKLFTDTTFLENQISFFLSKKQIRKISKNKELALAHLQKAKHNFGFFRLNKDHTDYLDWQVVVLYYALYHSTLALIINKQYMSKNHSATVMLLIKEYAISAQEAHLIDELSVNKEDAQLYTELKSDRHDASYSTSIRFSAELVEHYESEVLSFLNKTEEILRSE